MHARRTISLTALAALALLAPVACSSDEEGTSATDTSAAAVDTTSTTAADVVMDPTGEPDIQVIETSLGEILATDDGYPLYAYEDDTATTSECNGECAENWPPLLVGEMTVPDDVTAEVTFLTREDGATQAVINGHPAYSYLADVAFEADTDPASYTPQGQGAKDGEWLVLDVDGNTVPAA